MIAIADHLLLNPDKFELFFCTCFKIFYSMFKFYQHLFNIVSIELCVKSILAEAYLRSKIVLVLNAQAITQILTEM